MSAAVVIDGVPPAPRVHRSGIFSLNFDKVTPTNHHINTDTYHQESTLTSQKDARWGNCHIPSSISTKAYNTDMTVAIFVR